MKLRDMYIANAISSWENKLKGIYLWWETERYSKDWILSQIEYFKNQK